jgi:RHS repeat-associated protein
LTDHLGTARDLGDQNESTYTTTVTNHRTYNAFGKLTAESNSAIDSDPSYTGKITDSDTNLQNNLNRWYDAVLGKWLNEDPTGFRANDANLARSVHNSPLMFVDPSGLQGVGAAPNDGSGGSNPGGSGLQASYGECGFFEQYNPRDALVAQMAVPEGPTTLWELFIYNPEPTGQPTVWTDLYDISYGLSDCATLSGGYWVRTLFGYDAQIGVTDDYAYWGGAAIPPVVATGGAFVLPSGIGAPVVGSGTFAASTFPVTIIPSLTLPGGAGLTVGGSGAIGVGGTLTVIPALVIPMTGTQLLVSGGGLIGIGVMLANGNGAFSGIQNPGSADLPFDPEINPFENYSDADIAELTWDEIADMIDHATQTIPDPLKDLMDNYGGYPGQ